jgi:hypothetical protein
MKYVEQKLKNCKKCGRQTMHGRNNSKTTGLGILVHLILILFTAGVWLLPLLIWKMMTAKFGGWKCTECTR